MPYTQVASSVSVKNKLCKSTMIRILRTEVQHAPTPSKSLKGKTSDLYQKRIPLQTANLQQTLFDMH